MKHAGNRTGRQAKRRRRRHQRRLARGRVGALARRPDFFSVDRHIGVDLAAGPDRTVIFPPRVGKTARLAALDELLRSGRIRIPLPQLPDERNPLTDAELALRYAWSEFNSGEDPRTRAFRAADNEERTRDWSGKYLPPK